MLAMPKDHVGSFPDEPCTSTLNEEGVGETRLGGPGTRNRFTLRYSTECKRPNQLQIE